MNRRRSGRFEIVENADALRNMRREKMRSKMKRSKRRQMLFRKYGIPIMFLLIITLIGFGIFRLVMHIRETKNNDETTRTEQMTAADGTNEPANTLSVDRNLLNDESEQEADFGISFESEPYKEPFRDVGGVTMISAYNAEPDENTFSFDDSYDKVQSQYAILIDMSTGRIVAQKNGNTRISPASMTKILTVLVAAEHLDDWDAVVEISPEDTYYAYRHDLSGAGFADNERVTVRDLFYATILPSGAEAALTLARLTAGDQDHFAELMNEKIAELGLSDSAHFTNCVGAYDDNLYCTVYDMAMIMKAAVENDRVREVLREHIYTTSSTNEHPGGIELSNWFLRRIEDKDCGGEVLCAKTGFVAEAGNCAASYEVSASGIPYICVTGNAHSAWRAIYDHVALYKEWAK